MPRRRNPPNSTAYRGAKQLAEDFHGRESRGYRDYTRKFSYPKNLADLGSLEVLEVLTDDDKVQDINFQHGEATLAGTPDKKQLVIVGRVHLDRDEFEWIPDREWDKPKVIIGECLAVCYWADKHHLTGPKSQAKGVSYRHEFGEGTNIRPCIVYDRVNKVVELIGGEYTIEPEGITG